MKIQVPLLNAVRFATDEHTRLHVHTRHVDPREPLLVKPNLGPKLYLKRDSSDVDYPVTSAATPYGSGRTEMTAFLFGFNDGEDPNFATTAGASSPTLPIELGEKHYAGGGPSRNLTESFRMSLFLRPDKIDTGGNNVLIAGIPYRFGLYQNDDALVLHMHQASPEVDHWLEFDYELIAGAWLLLEVEWDKDLHDGVPRHWVNGVTPDDPPAEQVTQLVFDGSRFNLAHDPEALGSASELLYWSGAIRELELSDKCIWIEDLEVEGGTGPTDAEFQARAMRLFGLSTPSSPRASFSRAGIAWIKVGGDIHVVSAHHPRATERGTLVEEERENLIELSAPPMIGTDPDHGWFYTGGCLYYWTGMLPKGRFTLWFEQQNPVNDEPIYFEVYKDRSVPPAPSAEVDPDYKVIEGEAQIIDIESEMSIVIKVINPDTTGELTHVQLEKGKDFDPGSGTISIAVGPTSHIRTENGTRTRHVETLAFELTDADLDAEQGRLDLEITPQLDGPRAEAGDTALAGDILAMSLTRDEIVSVDSGGVPATLPGDGLWRAGVTRAFHVEWQPGARLLWEDSLQLVAAADYSGGWQDLSTPAWFYLGGAPASAGMPEVRANCFFRGLVLDDWVPRFHADLHRFMYRQFGTGAFSEDEASVFRKWRRVEADGLALMARLGDRLKEQAFADTVDLMIAEWERELGFPSLWGLPVEERRAILANLFKALGATDAEIEEQVSYVTRGDLAGDATDKGFAIVIERHKEDVLPARLVGDSGSGG